MYDVKDVKYLKDYQLEVIFENGEKGVVDLKSYLSKKGIFQRFADTEYFKRVYVNKDVGTLCWPEGEDIAPETLYAMATGKPLPDWMKETLVTH